MKKYISYYIILINCLFALSLYSQSYQGADFNGDGLSDLAHVWNDGGSLSVAPLLSDGVSFTEEKWVNMTGSYDHTQRWFYGDVNGDSYADAIVIWNDSGMMSADVYISTDTNSDFLGDTFVKQSWAVQSGPFDYADRWFVADFNGDFNVDLARLYNDDTDRSIDVYTSTGTGFAAPSKWLNKGGHFDANHVILLGDFNGDFSTDFAVIYDQANVYINMHISSGTSFNHVNWFNNGPTRNSAFKWVSGDYNGDGMMDLAALWDDGGQVSIDVYSSGGNSFAHANWLNQVGAFDREDKWFAGDFNGDFLSDFGRLWNDGGMMSVEAYESDGFSTFTARGLLDKGRTYRDQDTYMIGDFNGDLISDIAVTRGDTNNWYSEVVSVDGFGVNASTVQSFSTSPIGDYFDRHNLIHEVNGDKFIRYNDIAGAVPPGTDLQSVLDSGSDLLLVQGAVYNVNGQLDYKTHYQFIKTYDAEFIADYAIMRMQLDQNEFDSLLDANDMDYIHLENVTLDGNKYKLGQKAVIQGQGQQALCFFVDAEGAWVKRTVLYNTRTWSTLHIFRGTNAIVEHNYILGAGNGPRGNGRDLGELGNNVPGGTGNTGWADGISVGGAATTVRENFMMDCTDVGVVLFGVPGSQVYENMIANYSRECLGAINLVDASFQNGTDNSFDGGTVYDRFDYTNDIVRDNRIAADGARIQMGIPFGSRTWKPVSTPQVFDMAGGAIYNNLLEGGAFGYGIILDYVKNVNVYGNISTATHTGKGRGSGNNSNNPDEAVAFFYDQDHVHVAPGGTLQGEFVDNTNTIEHLLFMNGTPQNSDGFHYYTYTNAEIDATINGCFLEMLGRAPSGAELTAYRSNFNYGTYGTGSQTDVDYIGDYLRRELMLLSEFIDKFGNIPPENLHIFRTARWRDRIMAEDQSQIIATGNYPNPKTLYDNVKTNLTHPGSSNLDATITGISPSLPASMQQGDVVNLSITVRNDGTIAWDNSASNPQKFALGSVGDDSNFGVTRYYVPNGANILPGQSYTFNVTVTAPPVTNQTGDENQTSILLPLDFRMIQESVSWFGDSITDYLGATHNVDVEYADVPPIPEKGAVFISMELEGNPQLNGIRPGAEFEVSVVMKNSGNYTSTPWSRDNGFNMGSENPRDNFFWRTNRMDLPTGVTVSHGETVTLTRVLRAPGPYVDGNQLYHEDPSWFEGKTYDFQWSMVWFGQKTPNLQISVSNSAPIIGRNNSDYAGYSGPDLIEQGTPFTADLTFTNNGDTTWTSAGNYKLGNIEIYKDWTDELDAKDKWDELLKSEFSDSVPGKTHDSLFDNDTSTNYFSNHTSSWVQFEFDDSQARTITKYGVTSASDSGPGAEELNNGSFNSSLSGWNTGGTAAWHNGDDDLDGNPDQKAGGGCLKLSGSGGSANQTFSGLQPNTDYEISFWLRQLPGTQGLVVIDTEDYFDDDAQFAKSGGQPTEWEYFSAVFNTGNPCCGKSPNPSSMKVRIFTSGFSGTAYIDELSVVEVGAGGEGGDPASWTLSGSNDETNWTPLDTRSGIDFPLRSQRQEFAIATPGPYRYYRLDANNTSGAYLQYAEIDLMEKIETSNFWTGSDRVLMGGADSVAQGQNHTFTLNLTAPMLPVGVEQQDYILHARMLKEDSAGSGWFGEFSSPKTITVLSEPPPRRDAAFVSQALTGNPEINGVRPNAKFLARVTFENNGDNINWSFGDPDGAYKLGSQNAQDNQNWGMGRVEMDPGVTVAPTQQYEFKFIAQAPAVAGPYNFQWKMIQEGIEWFGDQSTNLSINVDPLAPVINFDDSDFISMTAPETVAPNTAFNVELTYRNTGTTDWDPAGSFGIALADGSNQTWTVQSITMTDDLGAPIATLPAAPDEVTPPATGIITVSILSPSNDGVTLPLQLITDMTPGDGKFGEESNSQGIFITSNPRPVWSSSPVVKNVDNGTFNGSLAGDVSDDDSLIYSLSYVGGPGSEPDWLTIGSTDGSLSGTIPSTPGAYVWTATVNDGQFIESETLLINVENWDWQSEYSGTHPNTLKVWHMNDGTDRDDTGSSFGLLNLTNTTGDMLSAGKFGTALSNTQALEWTEVNGTSFRPDSLHPAGADPSISVEFWVNINAAGGGTQTLVGYRFSYNYEFQKRDNDTIRFYLRGVIGGAGNTDSVLDSSAVLTPGVWHHVAGTWDAHTETQRLYIDGAEQPGAIVIPDFVLEDAAGDKALHLLNSWEQNRGANALMDEFRISDVAYVYGKTAEVPAVIGYAESAAEAAIIAEGYLVGTKTYTYTRGVVAGSVKATNPVPGTVIPEGSTVDLEIQTPADPASTIVWTGSADADWTNNSNWTGGAAPMQETQNLKVVFNVEGAPTATLDTVATVKQIVIGDGGNTTAAHVKLVNGADLLVGVKPDGGTEWLAVGYNKLATLTVETGALLTTAQNLYIANVDGSTGSHFYVNGGTVDIAGKLRFADSGGVNTAYATINYGGQVTANELEFRSLTSVLDIRNGTLILNGDQQALVSTAIAAGNLVAAGGAQTLLVDYNTTNTGKTTISYFPAARAIPNVVGQAQATAEANILAADFPLGAVASQYDNVVPAGSVISQSPVGGTMSVADPVDLVISLGVQTWTVPDVLGQTQSAATAAITAEDLTVGTVSIGYSRGVVADTVISTNPIAGTSSSSGAPVDILMQESALTASTIEFSGAVDGDWTNDGNWTGGVAPMRETQSFKIVFKQANAPEAVLTSAAAVKQMVIGDGGSALNNRVRLESGGDLFAGLKPEGGGDWTAIGWNTLATLTVENGAVFAAGAHMMIANLDGAGGSKLEVYGGSADVATTILMGSPDGLASGFLTVALNGQLSAGAFDFRNATSVVDIRQGSITLDGDKTADVATAIAAGNIVGFNGAQTVVYDYNTTTVGMTTITSTLPTASAIPNVSGQAEGAAKASIHTANFLLGKLTYEHSNTVAAGSVISQTPAAGTMVVDAAVNLVVSLGVSDPYIGAITWPGGVVDGDPGTGRTEDYDGDGKSNEYEYYFGLDAVSADKGSNEAVLTTDSNSPAVTFTYRTDNGGVLYYIDTSTDLVTWSTDQRASSFTDTQAPNDNGDGTETVTIRYNTPYSSIPGGKLFVRIRAEE